MVHTLNQLNLMQLEEELRVQWQLPYSIFKKKSSALPGHGRSTISVFRQMMGRILTGNQNSEWRNSGICQLIGSIESYGFHSMRLSQIGTGDLIGIGIQEREKTRQIFPAEIPVATNNHLPDKGLLLLEEMDQASIGIKVIVQKMILEHKIAGVPMKAGWNLIVVAKDLEDLLVMESLPVQVQEKFRHRLPICNLD